MPKYILQENSKDNILKRISSLDPSKKWTISIDLYKSNRSLDQNARLWKLHALAAQHTGYSAQDMHDISLARHFGTRRLGSIIIPLKRSSDLTASEFSEYMTNTEAFYATELGVFLDE